MPDSDAPPLASLRLYTATALAASGSVIGRYSTSFSLACRTLPPAVRRDIAGIYALVRVADEVVDGTAGAAGLEAARVRTALDGYAAAVNSALATGLATDLVIHGCADVARRHGFGHARHPGGHPCAAGHAAGHGPAAGSGLPEGEFPA